MHLLITFLENSILYILSFYFYLFIFFIFIYFIYLFFFYFIFFWPLDIKYPISIILRFPFFSCVCQLLLFFVSVNIAAVLFLKGV